MSIAQLIGEKDNKNIGIYLLKRHTALTNKKIGELFGNMPYTTVSKAFHRFSKRIEGERSLQKIMKKIEDEVSHVEA